MNELERKKFFVVVRYRRNLRFLSNQEINFSISILFVLSLRSLGCYIRNLLRINSRFPDNIVNNKSMFVLINFVDLFAGQILD